MSKASSSPNPLPKPVNNGLDRYLFGKGRTLMVFSLFCLLMIFDFADRLIIAALLPYIQAEWHITDAQSGLLSSLLTLGMVLFAFPVSILIDRWSRVKTASIMGIFWGIASASGAFAQSLGQLAISRALVGVGEAGYAPASYAWISAAFPRRRLQLALGVFSASQPIGMALGIALGGYIAAQYGWRHALGILAIPGILVAFALYKGRDYKNTLPATVKADASESPAKTEGTQQKPATAESQALLHWQVIKQNFARILRTPTLLLVYLSCGMSTLLWVPIILFLPTYFHRIHDIPLQQASLMTSVVLLVGIVTLPLGGWIMDRLTRSYRNAKIYFAVTALSLATLFYSVAFAGGGDYQNQFLLILSGSVALTLSSSGPLSMTQELAHPSGRALSGTTSVMAIHLLGSVPGPFIAGLLSDRYGLGSALTILSVFSGIATVLLLLLTLRFYQTDLTKVEHYVLEEARP